MNRAILLCIALTTTLAASAASAFTFEAFQAADSRRAIALPTSSLNHLTFDAGTMITIHADSWKLEGTLTGADGSRWAIGVDFGDLFIGPQFDMFHTAAHGGLMGNHQVAPVGPWGFAGTIDGHLVALDGELAGHTYSLTRNFQNANFLAEFDQCPEDVICDRTLSNWVETTDVGVNPVISVSNPVPEPSAALVFGLGTLIASSSMRRSRR